MSYTAKQTKEIKKIIGTIANYLKSQNIKLYRDLKDAYKSDTNTNFLGFIVNAMYNFHMINEEEFDILEKLSKYKYEDSNYLIAVYMCDDKYKQYLKNLKKKK